MIIGNPILLGGGGGVDITVVGGTSRPENPKNNTVWVNTSNAIGEIYISGTQPTSANENDIWVQTSNIQTIQMEISKSPFLYIEAANVKQYINSIWSNRVGSQIYTNGKWNETMLILYDGNWNIEATVHPFEAGGTGSSLKTSSLKTGSGYFGIATGKGDVYVMQIQPRIDFSVFKTIGVTLNFTGEDSGYLTTTVGLTSRAASSSYTPDSIINYDKSTIRMSPGDTVTMTVVNSNTVDMMAYLTIINVASRTPVGLLKCTKITLSA